MKLAMQKRHRILCYIAMPLNRRTTVVTTSLLFIITIIAAVTPLTTLFVRLTRL